jgi:hypothetical protein
MNPTGQTPQRVDAALRNSQVSGVGTFNDLRVTSLRTRELIANDLIVDGGIIAPLFVPRGLPGASDAQTRFVGGTTQGPPTTGTFEVGDYVVSHQDGMFLICIEGGSPGVWQQTSVQYLPLAGGTMRGDIDMGGNDVTGAAEVSSDAVNAGNYFELSGNRIVSSVNGTSLTVGLSSFSTSSTGTQNTSVGNVCLPVVTSGGSNVALGYSCQLLTTTASNNTVVGAKSLPDVTTSGNHTVVGYGNLPLYTTGSDLITVGSNCAPFLTTASDCIMVGDSVMTKTTSCTNSIGIGQSCFGSTLVGGTLTGTNNTGIGYAVMPIVRTGSDNTAIGYANMKLANSASRTCAFGYNVSDFGNLQSEVCGCGYFTLCSTTPGFDSISLLNSALGSRAHSDSFSAFNTCIGYCAAQHNNTICKTTVGSFTSSTGTLGYVTLLGINESWSVTQFVTQIGSSSIQGTSTGGNHCTQIGVFSLKNNTSTGTANTVCGQQTMFGNSSGKNCVAIGLESLKNNTFSSGCVAIGYFSLHSNFDGTGNVGIGRLAVLGNSLGDFNTGIGYCALGLPAVFNDYSNNSALGSNAIGYSQTTGNSCGIGKDSLKTISAGANLVGIGYNTDGTSSATTSVIWGSGGTSTRNAQLVIHGAGSDASTHTLAAGTATVNNAAVTNASIIILTTLTVGGTPGVLSVNAVRNPGTSFTVNSSSGTDTSTFSYLMFEP